MAAFLAPLIGGGIGALAGLFSKPKPITTTTDQTSTTDMWNRPEYDSNQLELRNRLINQYLASLEDEGDYWSGYSRTGMANLANSGAAASRNIENLLAARGIRGGAAGSALAIPQVNQQMQQATFLNSLPQLIDQRRREIQSQAGQFFSSMPYAQHQTGTQRTQGTNVQSGGNLSNLGAMFSQGLQGYAYGLGRGTATQTPQGPPAPIIGGTVPTQQLPSWLAPKYPGWDPTIR